MAIIASTLGQPTATAGEELADEGAIISQVRSIDDLDRLSKMDRATRDSQPCVTPSVRTPGNNGDCLTCANGIEVKNIAPGGYTHLTDLLRVLQSQMPPSTRLQHWEYCKGLLQELSASNNRVEWRGKRVARAWASIKTLFNLFFATEAVRYHGVQRNVFAAKCQLSMPMIVR